MNPIFEITPEIAQFRQSPILREKLAQLLKDPTMELAMKAVLSLSTPRSVPSPVPGNHPDTIIAHRFYNMLGVVKAVNTLSVLTTDGGPTGSLTSPEEEDFVSTIPKEYQEMPEAVKNQK